MAYTSETTAVLSSITFELIQKLKAVHQLQPDPNLTAAIDSIVTFREATYSRLAGSEITKLITYVSQISKIQSDFKVTWDLKIPSGIKITINDETVTYSEYEDRHRVLDLINKYADHTNPQIATLYGSIDQYMDCDATKQIQIFKEALSVINNNPTLNNLK